jgi:hypothetical protein
MAAVLLNESKIYAVVDDFGRFIWVFDRYWLWFSPRHSLVYDMVAGKCCRMSGRICFSLVGNGVGEKPIPSSAGTMGRPGQTRYPRID